MSDTDTLPTVDVRPIAVHLHVDCPPDQLAVVIGRMAGAAGVIALAGLYPTLSIDGTEPEDNE